MKIIFKKKDLGTIFVAEPKDKRCIKCKKFLSKDKFRIAKKWSRVVASGETHSYFGLRSTCKDCQNIEVTEYNKKHPRKVRTRTASHRALKKGIIKKTPCVICGEEKVEMHHVNYNKPLNVVFLCRKHHISVETGLIKLKQ